MLGVQTLACDGLKQGVRFTLKKGVSFHWTEGVFKTSGFGGLEGSVRMGKDVGCIGRGGKALGSGGLDEGVRIRMGQGFRFHGEGFEPFRLGGLQEGAQVYLGENLSSSGRGV